MLGLQLGPELCRTKASSRRTRVYRYIYIYNSKDKVLDYKKKHRPCSGHCLSGRLVTVSMYIYIYIEIDIDTCVVKYVVYFFFQYSCIYIYTCILHYITIPSVHLSMYIYIFTSVHEVLEYIYIYIYMHIYTPRTESWYIDIYIYITPRTKSWTTKKNTVPVRDTACPAG